MIAVVVTGAVYEATFPLPDAAKPFNVFELVQLNVAPLGVLVKFIAATGCPEQTV